MSRRVLVPALVGALAFGIAAVPASASHKKITGGYTATAQVPDPSPFATEEGICRTTLEQAKHVKAVKFPEAGTLEVTLSGHTGDWALSVRNDKDQTLGDSDQSTADPIDRAEKVKIKLKKAATINIVACNFLGGPDSQVKYTFTYLR